MDTIQKAEIILKNWLEKPQISRMHSNAKKASISKWMLESGKVPFTGGYPPYGYQKESIELFKKNIREFKDSNIANDVTIAFGDSIIAFTAKDLSQIDYRLNFGQPGSGSPNYLSTANDIYSELEGLQIKYVVVGCFGGNPLLSYQDFEEIKLEAKNSFDGIRKLFPNSRIIVYGTPPVYDVYANIFIVDFEKYLISLVRNDPNSVYIFMRGKFADKSGLYPDPKYSRDGVHLGGEGIIIFDRWLGKAKIVPAGTILVE